MCFGSRKGDGDAARSRELDRMIRQDEKRMAKEVKLLLLGKHDPLLYICLLQLLSQLHAMASPISHLQITIERPCTINALHSS